MAYIANRPVRFDRDYAIGERIPDGVIDPNMTETLIGMGRIIRIPDAEQQNTAVDNAGEPQSEDNSEGSINTQTDEENATEGISDGAEDSEKFVCEVCGKEFKSQNALAAHSRAHKD